MLEELRHANALLLDSRAERHDLRLAAVDRRLQAHQEAFTHWRHLVAGVHADDAQKQVLACQEWWEKNCLYLSAEARDAFSTAYWSATRHKALLGMRDATLGADNYDKVLNAGDVLLAAVSLPALGERESGDVNSAAATGVR